MLYIVIALYIEAKPLISLFNLKKDNTYTKFQVFSNENIKLIISGTGKIKSATALTYLISNKDIKENDYIINIGFIASSNNNSQLGDIVYISKIQNAYSDTTFYPEMIYKHNFLEGSLTTFDKIIENKIENVEYIDMEAYGFFQTASIFFKKDKIIVLKIVSDILKEKLEDRIRGRYALKAVKHPETKKTIVAKDELITEELAKEIVNAGITEVEVRSVVGCKCLHGICKKCYGSSLSSKAMVNLGETLGIVAAQAIGEPGTQLTMRTFHGGGVAGGDVTQGLPRVEELFEARKPKGVGIIAEIDGTVTISYDEEGLRDPEITITGKDETRTYSANQKILPHIANPEVDEKGKAKKVKVKAGDALTEGSLNPNDILTTVGIKGVYDYIVTEIQKVYRNQGVDINDKHIEIIIKQMLRKVKVIEPGDSKYMTSALVNVVEFEKENQKLIEEGKKPAEAKQTLLGITKASLATDSFLSAASFQETTKVLTDAAIKGKVDDLIGVKENVIIGKLIPAGTGFTDYRELTTTTAIQDEAVAKIRAEREAVELGLREEKNRIALERARQDFEM